MMFAAGWDLVLKLKMLVFGGLSLAVAMTAVAWGAERNGSATLHIVALGDSLTAGFELPPSSAFPVQLERALRARGHNVSIANAGVSGDTTSGGLQRIDWAVPDDTDAVILELGANDALRGIAPEEAQSNLDAMLSRLSQRGIPVLLAGMRSPLNWGKDYADEFVGIYPGLAERHGTLLYPFFMQGVALDPKLILDDGLHPNTEGVARIVEAILPKVEELIALAAKKAN
jgi:acyl-CoA thioesterase I